MADLKSCPFCGGNAFVSAKLPYFGERVTLAVVCEKCNASSKHKNFEEEAIEAWNRRTTVETNIYDKEETYPNCTVQVLTNTATGETSVGWWENGGNEDVDDK